VSVDLSKHEGVLFHAGVTIDSKP